MNTIRVIDFLLEFLPKPTGDIMSTAQNHLRSLVERYDALAPNWDEAPSWAQWYSIDAGEFPCWHRTEPQQEPAHWHSARYQYSGDVLELPLGIDWRLCKWQRPEGD